MCIFQPYHYWVYLHSLCFFPLIAYFFRPGSPTCPQSSLSAAYLCPLLFLHLNCSHSFHTFHTLLLDLNIFSWTTSCLDRYRDLVVILLLTGSTLSHLPDIAYPLSAWTAFPFKPSASWPFCPHSMHSPPAPRQTPGSKKAFHKYSQMREGKEQKGKEEGREVVPADHTSRKWQSSNSNLELSTAKIGLSSMLFVFQYKQQDLHKPF